jgi:hypothetical protein
MYLRVYDILRRMKAWQAQYEEVIAGLMIGGDWQEVDGWNSGVASGVRCCKGFAVHVKMTKEWHVISTSPTRD